MPSDPVHPAPPSPDLPLIELRDIRVHYQVDAALSIDHWSWQPGQRWAVLGGNGSGKTTLARLLADELRPARGRHDSPAGLDPRQVVHLSFDLQRQLMARDQRLDDSETRDDAFDPGTTVAQAVARQQPRDARLVAWLERFGLADIADRGIRFISTGESRKTLLARALYASPPLLVLDNPLAGLDAGAQRDFSQLLEDCLNAGQTLLPLLTHPDQLPSAITHVLWLEGGRVRAQGPREEVLAAWTRQNRRQEAAPAALPAPRPRPAWPADEPLIVMAGLSLRYGDQPILTDIHWRFEPGQHCQIVGPNGAGKSTLLSVISGDNPRAYGQPLWLFGKRRGSGESIWEIKARLGLVGTAWQLQRDRRERVLEVVASGLFDSDGLFDECSGSDRAAVLGWIRAAGLESLAETRYDRLSFGQQRLALIARAMVKTPLILILDEPCIGLDPEHRDAVLNLVDRIAAAGRTRILYVSHRPEETPRCINQRLALVPHPRGGYTAVVDDLEAAGQPGGASRTTP